MYLTGINNPIIQYSTVGSLGLETAVRILMYLIRDGKSFVK